MVKNYKLGEICEVKAHPGGWNIKGSGDSVHWKSGTIPFYQIKDIQAENLNPDKKLTVKAIIDWKLPLTTTNSLLLSTIGTIGKVLYPRKEKCCFASTIICLEPSLHLVNPNYLYYLLYSQEKRIKSFAVGSTVPMLTKTVLSALPVYLPSLPEQNQILQKFQIVYNKLFQSEVIYNDFLLKMIKKYLELGDLLFLKYKDSQIKIKEKFWINEGRSGTGLHGYSESLGGTVKWINQGVLTNNYFLTEYTSPSKWLIPNSKKKLNLDFLVVNSPVMPAIFTDLQNYLNWNQTENKLLASRLVFNLFSKKNNSGEENATLYFALRQKNQELKNIQTGSAFLTLKLVSLRDFQINWVSDPNKQKVFFTILNSKLSKIKDLHRKIKDLLLLKYFGKK